MEKQALTCQQCGAPLPMKENATSITCNYCGMKNVVEKMKPAKAAPSAQDAGGGSAEIQSELDELIKTREQRFAELMHERRTIEANYNKRISELPDVRVRGLVGVSIAGVAGILGIAWFICANSTRDLKSMACPGGAGLIILAILVYVVTEVNHSRKSNENRVRRKELQSQFDEELEAFDRKVSGEMKSLDDQIADLNRQVKR